MATSEKLSLKPPKKVKEPLNADEKTPSVAGFFSLLLNSVTQIHVAHLQTNSYAAHMALGAFYDKMSDLADGIIESYQATNGIVKGYTCHDIEDMTDCCVYMRDLLKKVNEASKLFSDSDLLNQVDEVKTLIKSTIYKLENLS